MLHALQHLHCFKLQCHGYQCGMSYIRAALAESQPVLLAPLNAVLYFTVTYTPCFSTAVLNLTLRYFTVAYIH